MWEYRRGHRRSARFASEPSYENPGVEMPVKDRLQAKALRRGFTFAIVRLSQPPGGSMRFSLSIPVP